jgi:hypothetical protein
MMTVRSIKINAGEAFSRLIRVYFRESNSKSERMVPYAGNIFQFAELVLEDTSSRCVHDPSFDTGCSLIYQSSFILTHSQIDH